MARPAFVCIATVALLMAARDCTLATALRASARPAAFAGTRVRHLASNPDDATEATADAPASDDASATATSARADTTPIDASPPAPPIDASPPAPVDAATYVFGKPGEFQRDMEAMGTSPRRLAAFGFLGLGIALAGDLFGVTDALLNAAPEGAKDAARRARLDTYYPIGDFKRYIDDEYRYEVLYPMRWLGDQAVYVARTQARSKMLSTDPDSVLRSMKAPRGPAALAAFGPPGGTFAENLSVFRSPVAGLKLRNLGAPRDAAQKLLDTSVAPPSSGKTATLLAAEERADGAYAFEYLLQLPTRRDGQPGRVLHNLAVCVIRGDELFTLTILCPEPDWPSREALFCRVAESFRVY